MSRALDDIAPAFRAACERWPHAPNFQRRCGNVTQNYEENAHGQLLLEWLRREIEGGNNHD